MSFVTGGKVGLEAATYARVLRSVEAFLAVKPPMNSRNLIYRLSLFLLTALLLPRLGLAQFDRGGKPAPMPEPKLPSTEKLFPLAKAEEKVLYSLDLARQVKLMEATPSGDHWYVVDAFANWQQITIDGHLIPEKFHEISATATKLSPTGDYVIWSGLLRGYTKVGFDSTTTYLYKDSSLIGSYVADYPSIEFSPSGRRWAALLPYAYEQQAGDRDFVIIDGKVAHKNLNYPHLFSFSHDEQHWAYRSTQGLQENFITDAMDSAVLLYKRRPAAKDGSYWDPTIWRYTPDANYLHKILEGRDYDFQFAHVARRYQTAYSSAAKDTLHAYISFNGKNQGLYRWVNSIMIDDSGNHIAYIAADPTPVKKGKYVDERRAVVVYDGKVIAGPFPGIAQVFMSPSGNHIAYGLDAVSAKFYLDKKVVAKTSHILDCVWSQDESKIAYVVVGEHDKVFVVSGGKRSTTFEHLGRIGFSADGNSVQFTGIRNGKLIAVKLPT